MKGKPSTLTSQAHTMACLSDSKRSSLLSPLTTIVLDVVFSFASSIAGMPVVVP